MHFKYIARRALVVVASALAISACTTTSTLRLSVDREILTTRGNAFTSPDQVLRDAIIEAATHARAGGWEWFVIEASVDASTSGVLNIPASATAYASGNASGWSGQASYQGGQTIPFVKPGARLGVQYGRGPKPAMAYDAAEVLALNKPKK